MASLKLPEAASIKTTADSEMGVNSATTAPKVPTMETATTAPLIGALETTTNMAKLTASSTISDPIPIGASATNGKEQTVTTHQLLQSAVQSGDPSSSDDDDEDVQDDDAVNCLRRIPPGHSIMEYLSSLPSLSQLDRGRLLSRVGVEAKRKEIAIHVGDERARDLNELEIKQMFNQLDNWKFSLVGIRFCVNVCCAKWKCEKDHRRDALIDDSFVGVDS